MTVKTIETLNAEITRLTAQRESLKGAAKAATTREINKLKKELAAMPVQRVTVHESGETTSVDLDDVVTDAEAEAFAKEQTDIVVGAIREAMQAEASYTGTLIEVAIECESLECWEAIKDAAYAAIEESIPGSIRNAFSVIKWALVNGELTDKDGKPQPINAIKKAKEAAKNKAASGGEKGSNDEGKSLPETGNTDLDIALQNIAVLNTKAGELDKAIKAGKDLLASKKANFLRSATANAIEAYSQLLATVSLVEHDIIDDNDLDVLSDADIEALESMAS